MTKGIRDVWRRITSTRYTRLLESEIKRERFENARLKAENQALLNSILGIAGLPPVTISDPTELDGSTGTMESYRDQPLSRTSTGMSSMRGGVARQHSGAKVVPQSRRRSWHQVNRLLELREARKKASET